MTTADFAANVAGALNQGADRFQAAVIDGVPTVIDTKTELAIAHAAEWGAEQMQTVLESLAARPTNVALFTWEGLR